MISYSYKFCRGKKFGDWIVTKKYVTCITDDYYISVEDVLVNPDEWLNHITSKTRGPSIFGLAEAIQYVVDLHLNGNTCKGCGCDILAKYNVCYKCLNKISIQRCYNGFA